jgi:uncharacterized protein YndB with AHSA1/START domain
MARRDCSFEQVDRLEGNVGYLEFDGSTTPTSAPDGRRGDDHSIIGVPFARAIDPITHTKELEMSRSANPDLDLTISRVIKAPRSAVWNAWTDRASFEQWWIPAPARCRVLEMDLRPGGAFVTQMSENGGEFKPHLSGCFLAVDDLERIVFTNALVGEWRPAEQPFMTAIITLRDHPMGTEYHAHVMHKSNADRNMHEKMGFHDGWGTVIEQLAALVEQRTSPQPHGSR